MQLQEVDMRLMWTGAPGPLVLFGIIGYTIESRQREAKKRGKIEIRMDLLDKVCNRLFRMLCIAVLLSIRERGIYLSHPPPHSLYVTSGGDG